MAQLFARDNKAFLTNYLETYGPVAKFHGFFGVSPHLRLGSHTQGVTVFHIPG